MTEMIELYTELSTATDVVPYPLSTIMGKL